MSEFQFAEPGWVHALWAVLVLGLLLLWLERRAGDALDRLLSPLLQGRLVDSVSTRQRLLRVVFLTLSLVFGVLALMRPQWGVEYVSTPRSSAELMICLDVSRSMLAEDVAPNRLERSKAEIRDLLGYLTGDHVGLIAFAGRATVLAPLTPDFGFLRLVLDEVGPNSVGRGGTRLEEPIRKALAGFQASGDISRSILLITDGEDLDSFPLEAAKEAAERGVSIIAIGIGSETGSEIAVTDPETGARTLIRDASGRPVISRLDGATLREIALTTNGAYVPAGTGVLDLESIYDRHIRALLRGNLDERGRAVRHDVFQWALLASLVFLLASVGVAVNTSAARPELGAALSLLLALLVLAPPVSAQQADDPNLGAPPGPLEPAPDAVKETEDPRELYNRALQDLAAGALDDAERALGDARARAATDGELRFRASWTLGFASAARADAALQAEPQQALQGLYVAADWYRDAVRLRPESEEARRSLEVVLQRALVLEDSLRDTTADALEKRLDELIVRQRGLLGALRALLDRANADPDAVATEAMRRDFRATSTEQRQILSEGDALAESSDHELHVLNEKPEAERSPEDAIRIAQLDQLLFYLHRGRERMGQARRELRQRRAQRSYRRGSLALTELKRARDQLSDPLRVLETVIADAVDVATQTVVLDTLESRDPNGGGGRPPWLTLEYLAESQAGVTSRSEELHARLAAGSGALEAQEAEAQEPDPERARFLASLREAVPLIQSGVASFAKADDALELSQPRDALVQQRAAISALMQARERFLDLRGLIEASYEDQQRIASVFVGEDEARLAEFAAALRELQSRNLKRSTRIEDVVEEQLAGLPESAAEPAQEEELEQARQRLEAAGPLLEIARSGMQNVAELLPDPNAGPPSFDLPELRADNQQAIRALEALRRLFFSIIEHLRETARNQQQLNDETEELSALGLDPNAPPQTGPLVPRQQKLSARAGKIAEALETQSRQDPGAITGGAPGPAAGGAPGPSAGGAPGPSAGGAPGAPDAEKLRRASELVMESVVPMDQAVSRLGSAPPVLPEAREAQDEALGLLLEALALLSPPQEQQQGEEQQQEPQSGDGSEPEEGPEDAQADPGQLLQSVQDREAQRREERNRRTRRGYDTVEKDW